MNRLWISVLVLAIGCSDTPANHPLGQRSSALTAYCTANVIGKGQKAVETDYLPRVIRCENGNAPLEALKAQAVSARSYLYYKLATSGSIADGQSDQVYSCGPQPTAIHYQAVEETAGQVLRYQGTQVAAFYVAGAIPTASNCIPKASDNDWSDTEKYVTYNWGKSGSGITQTTLGWVNSGNYANRGCKSQNGASCLASAGWGYQDILKYYYGTDIQLVTAEGSCVGNSCECSAGDTQSQACGNCGTRIRSCTNGCTWSGWSACTSQGVCAPGASQTDGCGDCGTRSRTCTSQCAWSGWSACGGQGPCSPGAQQTEACGNCGTRARTCTGQCAWPAWGACTGTGTCAPGDLDQEPCGDCGIRARACDAACGWAEWGACETAVGLGPEGECQTGEVGICAAGTWSCLDGQSTCEASVSASPEACDGVDNDCDGLTDEDNAPMVTPLPYAARIEALQAPNLGVEGQLTAISVTVQNLGTQSWADGDVWVVADGPGGGASSEYYDDMWPSEQLVAPLPATPAGESSSTAFSVRLRMTAGKTVTETFSLAGPTGPLACEQPWFELAIEVAAPPDDPPPNGLDSTDATDANDANDNVDGADGSNEGADGSNETDLGDGADGADTTGTDQTDGAGGSGADATDSVTSTDAGPAPLDGDGASSTGCGASSGPAGGGIAFWTMLMGILLWLKRR